MTPYFGEFAEPFLITEALGNKAFITLDDFPLKLKITRIISMISL